MDIRYQIFVSSTFRDLQKERQAVLDAVLELGHFPAGMEVFPAASATPWGLIQKIISESDYYILIIGGRYGSTDEHGISYTEREYDLAQELNIPTLVFLPADTDAIPAGKSELDPASRESLARFRDKAEKHHCKFWKSPEELQAKVILGLTHEIRVNPRIGWMRAIIKDTPETLKRLNLLLEQNNTISEELRYYKELNSQLPTNEDIFANGDEEMSFEVRISHTYYEHQMTWRSIFEALAPMMQTKKDESSLIYILLCSVFNDPTDINFDVWNPFIREIDSDDAIKSEDWQRITLQFLVLGYWQSDECSRFKSSGALLNNTKTSEIKVPGYKLTPLGIKRLAESKAQRK